MSQFDTSQFEMSQFDTNLVDPNLRSSGSGNTFMLLDAWLYSPESTVHVANDRAWFTDDYTPCALRVVDINEDCYFAIGVGTVILPVKRSPDEKRPNPQNYLVLHDVAHVPTLSYNIFGGSCQCPRDVTATTRGFNYEVQWCRDSSGNPTRAVFDFIFDSHPNIVTELTTDRVERMNKTPGSRLCISEPPFGPETVSRGRDDQLPIFHKASIVNHLNLCGPPGPSPLLEQGPMDSCHPRPTQPVVSPWIFSQYSNVHVCRGRAWFTDAYVPMISTVVCGGIKLDAVSIGIVELEVHERLVLTIVLHVPSAVCNVFKLPLSQGANRILAIQSPNGNFMESVMVDKVNGDRVIAEFKVKSAMGFLRAHS
ncbi:hypothetical protein ACHAP5_007327 [Fusarium lateritium]